MTTTRSEITKLFEDYFSEQLNRMFDENLQIQDVEGFDSLAMVDLSIEYERRFNDTLNLQSFRSAVYFKDVIDEAMNGMHTLITNPSSNSR